MVQRYAVPVRPRAASAAPPDLLQPLAGGGRCSSRGPRSASSMTGPWPGQMVLDLVRLGERVQAVERVEVGAELRRRVGHDRRAAAEHGVAGEHGPLGGQHERQRVGGVARRRDDVHLQAVDRHHVAVAEALGAEAVRRVQGAYAAPDALRELPRRLGVVEVVVGEQHDGHVAGRLARPRRGGPASGGPGSTTTDRRPPGSRSTQVLVPSRVIGEALGASTHTAARPERAARPRLTRAAAPPARAAARGSTATRRRPTPRPPA